MTEQDQEPTGVPPLQHPRVFAIRLPKPEDQELNPNVPECPSTPPALPPSPLPFYGPMGPPPYYAQLQLYGNPRLSEPPPSYTSVDVAALQQIANAINPPPDQETSDDCNRGECISSCQVLTITAKNRYEQTGVATTFSNKISSIVQPSFARTGLAESPQPPIQVAPMSPEEITIRIDALISTTKNDATADGVILKNEEPAGVHQVPRPPPYCEQPVYTVTVAPPRTRRPTYYELPPPYDPSMRVTMAEWCEQDEESTQNPIPPPASNRSNIGFLCKPDNHRPMGFFFRTLELFIITTAVIGVLLFLWLILMAL